MLIVTHITCLELAGIEDTLDSFKPQAASFKQKNHISKRICLVGLFNCSSLGAQVYD
jgi:hypothetical protein